MNDMNDTNSFSHSLAHPPTHTHSPTHPLTRSLPHFQVVTGFSLQEWLDMLDLGGMLEKLGKLAEAVGKAVAGFFIDAGKAAIVFLDNLGTAIWQGTSARRSSTQVITLMTLMTLITSNLITPNN